MNPPKYNEYEYINFLIASPGVYSCTEAARVQPEQDNPPPHDAITRLLHRLELDSDELWAESEGQVDRKQGVLVLDDSTLDKHYAKQIELVTRHWSGRSGHAVSDEELWACHSEELGSEAADATRNPSELSLQDQFRGISRSLCSLEMT